MSGARGAGRGRKSGAVTGDENPRADPHFDVAFDFERDQGFPDGCTAHLELLGQFPFGR
ncbi:hypothetical protein D9M68_1000350 [compost metagenome]